MRTNYVWGVVALLVAIGLISFAVYQNRQNDDSTINPTLSVSVHNQTQNADGAETTAHPKDTLVYTLTAENPSDEVIPGYVMQVGIGGATNNATLIDAQGANFNSSTNSLIWTPLDIPANGSVQKQFTLRVKDTLPTNTAERVIKISFNNEVVTNLAPRTVATNPPGTVGSGYQAPKTGIPGWISFYLACFVTFGVLLFRVAYKLGSPMNQ